MRLRLRRRVLVSVLWSIAALWLIGCHGEDASSSISLDPGECPLPELPRRSAVVGGPVGCGGCDTRCRITTDDPDQTELDTDNEVTSVGVVEDIVAGGIIIDPGGGTTVEGNYAWVANTWQSTVTKIHLDTHLVEGVYRVGLSSQHDTSGDAWDCGNRPSRSAVDASGDAYIASRGFCGIATVTKFAGDPTRCKDYNGDLDILDTSSGLGDIRGWPDDADKDECMLWQVTVGGSNDVVRCLALDGRGRIWVGLQGTSQMVVLDPAEGDEIETINMGLQPYGAVMDGTGKMWVVSHFQRRLQWVDASVEDLSTTTVSSVIDTPASAGRPYGIAVGGSGRIFLGDHDNGGLMRYDPAAASFAFPSSVTLGTVGGIAVREDGMVFTADFDNNSVTVYDSESLADIEYHSLGAGTSPRGVCIDFDGMVWAANFDSPTVSVVDPDPVTGGLVDTITVNGNNYTYSDFTGYSLMTYVASAASLVREYRDSTTCLDPLFPTAVRSQLFWEAAFPDGGELVFYGSSSDDPDAYDNETVTEVLLGSTTDPTGAIDVEGAMRDALQDPEAEYFWLRIEIHRGGESPVLQNYTLMEYCL